MRSLGCGGNEGGSFVFMRVEEWKMFIKEEVCDGAGLLRPWRGAVVGGGASAFPSYEVLPVKPCGMGGRFSCDG